jgi:hypothetical protein
LQYRKDRESSFFKPNKDASEQVAAQHKV